MLAVHGLLGDPETLGDLLPGPPQRPGVINLEDLQPFGELPEGRHGAEPGLRVGAGRTLGDLEYWFHGRQHMLTAMERQHMLTDLPSRGTHQPTLIDETMDEKFSGISVGLDIRTWVANGVAPVKSEVSSNAAGRSTIASLQELKSFTRG